MCLSDCASLPGRKAAGFDPSRRGLTNGSEQGHPGRSWATRTLAAGLARERLIYPGEEHVLAALEAAQVTGEVCKMVGNLVADVEARETMLRDALEDLLVLFKRMGPSALKYGAVQQAERTLEQIPPRPMRLKKASA